MTRVEALVQNLVERVLETGQTLGRVIILVVNMDISFIDSLFYILRKQTLVHIGLRGLGRELHHHSRRRVSIHVGILTSNVIGLSVNDFLENLAGLGLAREIPLVPVCNVFLRDLLARTFHQFEFYAVLNLLDTHLFGVLLGDGISNLCGKDNVFAVFGHIHGLENGRNDFLVVEVNETSVPFDYILDHNIRGLCYLSVCTVLQAS